MILPGNYHDAVKAKQMEFERKRLKSARMLSVPRQPALPRYNRLLADLGGWLVRSGEALEARYAPAQGSWNAEIACATC